MSRLKTIQPYLWIVEKFGLTQLIIAFILTYSSLAVIFAFIYHEYDLVFNVNSPKETVKFIDHLYFSFITQSTVGYGDLLPRRWGRLLVVLQTITVLVFAAVGTGAIFFRVLVPQKNSVEFDKALLFYPLDKRFRFRYINRLPVELYMANIEMRLRRTRTVAVDEEKISRKTVELLSPTITVLPSMRPLMGSTIAIEKFIKIDDVPLGASIRLEPWHLDPDCEVLVVMTAQYFAGDVRVSKTWEFEDIYCGRFARTYDRPSEVELREWNKKILTLPEVCPKCDFEPNCLLKEKLIKS